MMQARYYSTSELAEKTGTSRQVISAIINDNWKQKRISQATYDRITQAMDDIGFVPNRTAISLRKKKQGRVGLLCHGPLYSHTLTALEKLNHYFLGSDQSLQIHVSADGGLADAVRELMGSRVDSIIILMSPMLENFGVKDLDDKALHKLLQAVPHYIYNFPFDVPDRVMEEKLLSLGSHLIGFSRNQAYLSFLEYLEENKLTRVLIDEKIFDLLACSEQTSALCKSFSKIQTYPNPQGGNLAENTFHLGEQLAHDLLADLQNETFDYLITFSDGIAEGAASILEKNGFKVGEDIHILGFDKIDSLKYLKHRISTIEVPVDSMFAKLIELLEKPHDGNFPHRSMPLLHLAKEDLA